MVVVGTRPEIIRLSQVIPELKRYIDVTLVHTGQNFTKSISDNFFDELSVPEPDVYLHASHSNTATTIANIIAGVDRYIQSEQPDAFLILGDTNSALSVIPAKKRKIPIFHMEAGNRSFDERVPEEINRRIVDHTSDINMPYTEHARRNLLREGFNAAQIIKTGSPMAEIIKQNFMRINKSSALNSLRLEKKKYILASTHREENVDDPQRLSTILTTLKEISETYNVPVILSTHPRTRKSLSNHNIEVDQKIQIHEPFGFIDYLALQKNALFVISDSGTITEESIILGFPAINMRESQERPEGLEAGRIPMSGISSSNVQRCTKYVLSNTHLASAEIVPADYTSERFSNTVTNAVLSYTEYVRRVVWQGIPANYK